MADPPTNCGGNFRLHRLKTKNISNIDKVASSPKVLRQRLNLNLNKKGDIAEFELNQNRVTMKHLSVSENTNDYGEDEWAKIERLAKEKRRTFKTIAKLKRHLKNLSK